MQAAVVIEETDSAHFMAVGDRRSQLTPRRTGTVNQHLGQRGTAQLLAVQAAQPVARQRPRSADRQQQQHGLNDAHAARHARNADTGDQRRIQRRIECEGAQHHAQGGQPGMAKNDAVETVFDKDGQRQQHGRHRRAHRLEIDFGKSQPQIEAQIESQPDRHRAQPGVAGKYDQALGKTRQGQHRQGKSNQRSQKTRPPKLMVSLRQIEK